MSNESHTNAPSASPNTVLTALGMIGLSVTVIAVSLAMAVQVHTKPKSTPREFDEPWGRKILAGGASQSLVILGPETKTSLNAADLAAWHTAEATIRKPHPQASLIQYFYARTGTAHPWTAYAHRDSVRSHSFNSHALGEWLQTQGQALSQTARDAELVIENSRAVKFTPERNGYTLDGAAGLFGLPATLLAGATEFTLPLRTSSPKLRLADLNSLGIKERIARGQSDFAGSSASRIQNIRVGSSQFNGVIIKPGEEFSFNTGLGTVTEAKGYLPELVIKREGVAKELGGGLCQVATTMFRSAFFAGLPITARRNHSYAVRYYEWISETEPRSAGLDATIYPGAQDLKFINDTPGHILIWTSVEGKRLYFDFYGTGDGRQIAVDGPYEYDRKPTGALKAKVTRLITKNGVTEEKVFNSNYVSPNLYPKLYELPKPETNPPPPPALDNEQPI